MIAKMYDTSANTARVRYIRKEFQGVDLFINHSVDYIIHQDRKLWGTIGRGSLNIIKYSHIFAEISSSVGS